MNFLIMDNNQLIETLNDISYRDLQIFTRYINDVAPGSINIVKLNSTKKMDLVSYLASLLSSEKNVVNIYKKLSSTELSNYLYKNLIWSNSLDTIEVEVKYQHTFLKDSSVRYGVTQTKQDGNLLFITRLTRESYGFYDTDEEFDKLIINREIRALLKILFVIPDDFNLEPVTNLDETEFTYSNENEVFNFINVISEMLSNNLVEFGKTNEKPLAKTLNILKSSTGINEFYSDKKLDSFATDMLTRSFSYYYWAAKKFKESELDSLKEFTLEKFQDKYYFFITRILVSHLKKIRYDHHYLKEYKMFNVLTAILSDLPKDSWVEMQNILKYCDYREYRFDLENKYRTDNYKFECDIGGRESSLYVQDDYNVIFFEPILKGVFFYLGALGLVELKYDKPKSPYHVKAKGKEYISTWDSLKYVKMTQLGKYVFGFKDSYEQKVIEKKTTKLKFDEYKPIITIDVKDTITQAKLEPYTDKYSEGKYILSYAKIFRDCKNIKALELKIDSFYKLIEANPPQIFKDFFAEIKDNKNLLKRDLSQVVIELKDNKKLLNLFMKNKKLQELVIKAQGYRVIVSKIDIPKLTKIVKDNGFFVEF